MVGGVLVEHTTLEATLAIIRSLLGPKCATAQPDELLLERCVVRDH